MVRLLIAEAAPGVTTPDHCFGGLPIVPVGTEFTWPCCKTCHGPMQFLGRLRIPGRTKLVLLFMCQNDPGMCDEWDANAGGNCAIVVPTRNLRKVPAPQEGNTRREKRYGARQVRSAKADYEEAREAWAQKSGKPMRKVLGQLLGKPFWIQAQETPKCNFCRKRMTFLAQLEEGPDWKTEMNFGGGGCAYVFECPCGKHSAKFLWQC